VATFPSFVPTKLVLFQDNTQLINIIGLRDSSGNFLSAATLRADLLDGSREPVAGLVDIVLSYVPSSNGNYSGTVTATFAPAVGTEYTLVLDGDSAASHLHIEIPVEVKTRTS